LSVGRLERAILLENKPSLYTPAGKRVGFVDNQRASQKILAIASPYTAIYEFLAHFDETKASRLSGQSVDHNAHCIRRKSVAEKPGSQFLFLRLVR